MRSPCVSIARAREKEQAAVARGRRVFVDRRRHASVCVSSSTPRGAGACSRDAVAGGARAAVGRLRGIAGERREQSAPDQNSWRGVRRCTAARGRCAVWGCRPGRQTGPASLESARPLQRASKGEDESTYRHSVKNWTRGGVNGAVGVGGCVAGRRLER